MTGVLSFDTPSNPDNAAAQLVEQQANSIFPKYQKYPENQLRDGKPFVYKSIYQ
jgi:hypothetical protein